MHAAQQPVHGCAGARAPAQCSSMHSTCHRRPSQSAVPRQLRTATPSRQPSRQFFTARPSCVSAAPAQASPPTATGNVLLEVGRQQKTSQFAPCCGAPHLMALAPCLAPPSILIKPSVVTRRKRIESKYEQRKDTETARCSIRLLQSDRFGSRGCRILRQRHYVNLPPKRHAVMWIIYTEKRAAVSGLLVPLAQT